MERNYKICWVIVKFLFCLWPVKVIGQPISQTGPLIIAANHNNFLEPPLISKTFRRRLWFLAKSEVLNWFFIGWLIRKFNWALPISKNSPASLRQAAELLRNGATIVIFPTGGKPVEMENARQGLAWLARKTSAPIVCMGINGTQRALKKGTWALRPVMVKIRVGKPIYPQPNMTKGQIIQTVLNQINLLRSQG